MTKYFLLIILLCLLCLLCLFYFRGPEFFSNDKKIKFKAPFSRTKLKSSLDMQDPLHTQESKELSLEQLSILVQALDKNKSSYEGNILSYPSFFYANEKWPGCLPRPLSQGSCGSCWGFAAVTALSSRFYIESCGVGGCNSYPQINFGSLNSVNNNINQIYKFRKLYLNDVFKYLDISDNGYISKKEWSDTLNKFLDVFNSPGSPLSEKHYVSEILIYLLNFQSLGSVDLTNKQLYTERINESFDIWLTSINVLQKSKRLPDSVLEETLGPTMEPDLIDQISINKLMSLWNNEPIALSAEKIITCCIECTDVDFGKKSGESPACAGGSLEEAWSTLRESGTPTALCIGYSLDSWSEGSIVPTCRESQGPFYSFCSGYALNRNAYNIGLRSDKKADKWSEDISDIIDKYENSSIEPIAIPHNDQEIPWSDPQLFKFRAKNVYKIKNDVKSIQTELLERGPVTTGFIMYPDFQYDFGTDGFGGQLYDENSGHNPVGSTKHSLIYKWSGVGEPIGGHAIVIVGYGLYKYKDLNIPYWICLNSWSVKWGHNGFSGYLNREGLPINMKYGGYFWMLRGTDECAIESNVICGQPDLENITYPGTVEKYGWSLPNPDPKEVLYVKKNTKAVDLGPRDIGLYKEQTPGGGSYNDRYKISYKEFSELQAITEKTSSPTKTPETGPKTDSETETSGPYYEWVNTSMKVPSPYTLFWNDQRPIYCIGALTENLSSLSVDDLLSVSDVTILEAVRKVQNNPLLVIEDEQLQLINIIKTSHGYKLKVYRAVNNSIIESHDINAIIKIIPFNTLSVDFLDTLIGRCNISENDPNLIIE